MNQAQSIIKVLMDHGDGDQIRYLNQLLQKNGEQVVNCAPKRVFDHHAQQLGVACNIPKEDSASFTEWLNGDDKEELNHSQLIEKMYLNDNLTINGLVMLAILLKKVPPQIFNALLHA